MHSYNRFLFFLIRRVVAPGFVLFGSLLTLVNLPSLAPGATIEFNGVPTDDLVIRSISVLMPLVVAILGVMLYRAKPPSDLS